ncbi:MAG: threonine synthase [Planctomycetota bacterium]
MTDLAFQKCINPACRRTFDLLDVLSKCPECGNLLDVRYDWDRLPVPESLEFFESRWANRRDPLDFSGVWRFRELIPFADPDQVLTIGEGQTLLKRSDDLAPFVGINEGDLFLQYEGLNLSGSFKDNGMTGAFTHARMTGATRAACASTGNTSASLACFAAASGLLEAIIFVGSGKIAYGKLSQALDYGGKTIQIEGDFDDAMARVQEACDRTGMYLMNSLNPFRLEGQKAIMFRVLEGLAWQPPDWIVVPGGNLGNSSAFGKAFIELKQLGLIDRVPRIAVINSTGADTLARLVNDEGLAWNGGEVDDGKIENFYALMDEQNRRAKTMASAIEINRPVNLKKCLRTLDFTDGVVRAVPDQEIIDAKAMVGRCGIGCEPASAASVAGAKRLRLEGVIEPGQRVVCILTGHLLKDPNATVAYHSLEPDKLAEQMTDYHVETNDFANRPIPAANDLDSILKAVEEG